MSNNDFSRQDLKVGGVYYNKIVSKTNGLFYTKHINRPLAWYFTRNFYFLSPNFISLTAFCVLVFALGFFRDIDGLFDAFILYLLIALNYVLDSVDGQVARLTGKGSPVGEWLDHSLDAIRLVLVNVFLIDLIFNQITLNFPSFLIFSCLIGQVGLYTVGILREKILDVDISKNLKENHPYSKLVFLALTPADYGFFIIMFTLTSTPSLLANVYILYGIYKVALLIVTMVMIFKTGTKNQKKASLNEV